MYFAKILYNSDIYSLTDSCASGINNLFNWSKDNHYRTLFISLNPYLSTLKNKNMFMISMVSSIRYITDILKKPSNKQNYWPQYSAKLWCEFQLVEDKSTVIIIHHSLKNI